MNILTYYPQLSLVLQPFRKNKVQAFLVGGAVRDYYLKRPGCHDFDFALKTGSIPFARRFARLIKVAFVLLDKEHGSARVVKKEGGQIVTFDFTDWRGKSIQEDVSLRDFTVNAMAVDVMLPQEDFEEVHLPSTQRDLAKGVVRMVNPKVFKDDPLRLLRAYVLWASLGFKIEARTKAQIKKDAYLISSVATERIRDEIFKILASSRAYEVLSEMDKIGLLPQVIPQIMVMYKVPQGGYHHLDVWEHSLETVAQLEKMTPLLEKAPQRKEYLAQALGGGHTRLSLLKMAALLHDIGKPETMRQEKEKKSFHGHEHVGESIVRQIAKQLKLSVKERYFLEDAVRMHLRPGYLSNFKRPGPRAVFRYFRDAGDEAASLAVLALADQAATRGPLTTKAKHAHHAKICQMLIDKYFALKEEKPKDRLLTGKDLIKILKLKPSPLFGKILRHIEESAALGKITTKDEALVLARQLIVDG
ncbi:MAG: HD domain-containing protein [Candidatus Omnitrophica bacterium]|nr:HD domain-containing protein [Candidatus Omnitrophota bacterium]